jgi:hypothetical protein
LPSSVQNIVPSRLPSKSVKVNVYKNTVPVVLMAGETRSLTIKEEHKIRVSMLIFWVVTPFSLEVYTKVSEEHNASIFMDQDGGSRIPDDGGSILILTYCMLSNYKSI